MKEREMRVAVTAYLEALDYAVGYELLPGEPGYRCDVVGVRFYPRRGRAIPVLGHVAAVELKCKDVAGVIAQGTRDGGWADHSWAAMPAHRVKAMRPATLERFVIAGVGLLAVDVGRNTVRVVELPRCQYHRRAPDRVKGYWWRVYRRLVTEGGGDA